MTSGRNERTPSPPPPPHYQDQGESPGSCCSLAETFLGVVFTLWQQLSASAARGCAGTHAKEKKEKKNRKGPENPSAWERRGHGAGIDSINRHARNWEPRWRRTNRTNGPITSASPHPDSEEEERRTRTFLTYRPGGL